MPDQVQPEPIDGEIPPVKQEATPSQDKPIPKTKEDWDNLAKEEPQRWISLTQARMDQTIRQNREFQEKLEREKTEKQNLSTELEALKKGQKPPETTAPNLDS